MALLEKPSSLEIRWRVSQVRPQQEGRSCGQALTIIKLRVQCDQDYCWVAYFYSSAWPATKNKIQALDFSFSSLTIEPRLWAWVLFPRRVPAQRPCGATESLGSSGYSGYGVWPYGLCFWDEVLLTCASSKENPSGEPSYNSDSNPSSDHQLWLWSPITMCGFF